MAGAEGSDPERDSRWPLFAQGRPGDRAKPNAWQVMILSDLSGPSGTCPGATDDEVFGVLGQWGAAASWLESRKLAVARELIRRRPDGAGTATESGLPWDWDDRLAREVSLQLGVSVPAAQKLLWTAWALEVRLPKVGRALDQGLLDAGRARMIVEETNVLLEPERLAAAEQLIINGLGKCRTWADLLRLVQRAVITVDPQGAEKRREQEEKENARVRFWREAAGTCALMGAGLPTDEALQAHARIEQRAQAYRAAGARRPIEILRVAAYLDLLNGASLEDRVARFTAEDDATATQDREQAARDARMRAAAKAARNRRTGNGADDADGRPPGQDAPEGSTREGDAGENAASQDAPGDGTAGDSASGGYPWNCPAGDDLPSADDPCGGCGPGDCPCQDWTSGEPPCEACGRDVCQCDSSASNGGPADGDTGSHGGQADGNGRDDRNPASDGSPADAGGNDDGDGTGGENGSGPGDGGRGPRGGSSTGSSGPGTGSSGPGTGSGGPGGGGAVPGPEPGVASEVNLTLRHLDIPLLTALGRAQRPGEARSLGALDPGLARRLAEAAARHPGSRFCVTIVDGEGHAIGHGCGKPRSPHTPRSPRRKGKNGKNGRNGRKPRGQRDGPPPPPATGFTFTPTDAPGPPGGLGSWLLTLHGRTGQYTVDLHPVPTGECGHQYESHRHDPGDLLRHLVHIRDGKCGFPTCSRHAKESDFEHAQPFDQGGRTCGCNCWSASRSCHQVKQSEGWDVTETRPGYHQWRTPSGRTFTQEPREYPA